MKKTAEGEATLGTAMHQRYHKLLTVGSGEPSIMSISYVAILYLVMIICRGQMTL